MPGDTIIVRRKMPKAKKKSIRATHEDPEGIPAVAATPPATAAPAAAAPAAPAAAAPAAPAASAGPPAPPVTSDPVILSDEEALFSIRQGSREKYRKTWLDFKAFFPEANFEERRPSEEEIREFFIHMRTERGCAASTIWTNFSMVNSLTKGKYSFDMRSLPRIVTLIKSFEGAPKKKAAIFTVEELKAFCSSEELEGGYWLVRKAIVILAYFGGLRLTEAMNLVLEKIVVRRNKGMRVYHSRSKQRTDKLATKFDVPNNKDGEEDDEDDDDDDEDEEEQRLEGEEGFDWAGCLNQYVTMVKEELGKHSGRVFYTGRKDGSLTKQVMGRNMVSDVPHLVANWLGKENPEDYTFHSFRRSSATAAADRGATAQQMVDFFGWKSHAMTSEYISTSDHQLDKMAKRLSRTDKTKRIKGKKAKKDKKRKRKERDTDEEEEEEDMSSEEEQRVLKKNNGKKVVIINM